LSAFNAFRQVGIYDSLFCGRALAVDEGREEQI
jgi:hypothetical protein